MFRRVRGHYPASFSAILLVMMGCQAFVDDADREVYRLIEQRQREALGRERATGIGEEHVPIEVAPEAYAYVPEPTSDEVPASFAVTQPAAATQPSVIDEDVTSPTTMPADWAKAATVQERPEITLADAMRYAFQHAREFQTAKEDLYLAALALTLERFLWTPQFVGEVGALYDRFGPADDKDEAFEAVAELGVTQRLPYGGEVGASVINNLMRNLRDHVTESETAVAILEANIPLLRGAGKVAMESRYQAERDLIYATRAYERFRRALAVSIAGEYFNLQQLRQSIINAQASIESLEEEVARARALWETGRLIQLEVQRAEQDLLLAINNKIDAIESYETTLDRFKVRLGMPTDHPIDVEFPEETYDENELTGSQLEARSLEEALRMPDVSEEEAIDVALKWRLDLMNDRDRIDDAARGVDVAENNLLPDLNAFGSVAWNTNPDQKGIFEYSDARVHWQTGVTLELPLNRQRERNQLRESLIFKRRAERNYEEARDIVRLEARRAMRRVTQENAALEINLLNRDLALKRRMGARIRFDKGEVHIREITDAEEQLLLARNRLARSYSSLRLAILEFRRDTGTLRITDEGFWTRDDGSSADETIE